MDSQIFILHLGYNPIIFYSVAKIGSSLTDSCGPLTYPHHFFFSTAFLSGTRCSRLILCTSCPSSGISHQPRVGRVGHQGRKQPAGQEDSGGQGSPPRVQLDTSSPACEVSVQACENGWEGLHGSSCLGELVCCGENGRILHVRVCVCRHVWRVLAVCVRVCEGLWVCV